MHLVETSGITNELLGDIAARDCVLWITAKSTSEATELSAYLSLAHGPWRAVFVESSSGAFASVIEGKDRGEAGRDSAGAFSHVIASDPTSLLLQRRAKPIFLLNGRADRAGVEGDQLPPKRALIRRGNMTAKLRDLEPRRVVVVGPSPLAAVEDLVDLWDSEFRALLTLVTDQAAALGEAAERLRHLTNLSVVQWLKQEPIEFARELTRELSRVSVEASVLVDVQVPGGPIVQVDLARAELAEQPIADICEFIRTRDLLPVAPADLREEEFQKFFARGAFSWRPYAAGLPWVPDPAPTKELLKQLKRQLNDPPGSVQVTSVVSEPGAGGTTQARLLAFEAARAGFPVLLVKQQSEVPSMLELTGFLFRAVKEVGAVAAQAGHGDAGEPVWVLVLDVQHGGRGLDDLQRVCGDLIRSGRKVAVLKVVSADAPLDPPDHIPYTELTYVGHELESGDVEDLGRHLNAYLRNFGKEKASTEWISFWRSHKPDLDTGVASFWIALEFWLSGFMALGESIQSWAVRQFKTLSDQREVQRALMEIAALSVERKATPERLLMPMSAPKLPWSYALEGARRETPGLGIVQATAVPYGRVWAIAHDVLARYLLNGIWNDRLLCDGLSLPSYEDPVDLRLAMIAEVSRRTSTGEVFARPFAVALATHVLKLDEQQGNAEFFKYWRKVLAVLDSVPETVRLTSRAFNHHVAISRRRVTQGELFAVSEDEKKELLRRAVQELEFALNQIDASREDESNLNILNTLALVYQDLAEIERLTGASQAEVSRLLASSDEVTNRALKENPNSSYVLETAAKNLLRQTSVVTDETFRVESAAKALSFVFQASRLDTAYSRGIKLGILAGQALRHLRGDQATAAIETLCAQSSPFGYIAKAWRMLPIEHDSDSLPQLDAIGPDLANRAVEVLKSAPVRDWLLVRLQYDLAVIADAMDFEGQLRLLDELAATPGYHLSLQQVLERAVLLHFAGRHKQALDEFKGLRPAVKDAQVVVFVPQRLRWLPKPDRSSRATCSAQVVDSAASMRPMARVTELGNALAPFNPNEFGKARMSPNERFKCQVTFSAMGPFLKPVEAATH